MAALASTPCAASSTAGARNPHIEVDADWIAPDGADHHMAAIAAEAPIAAVCHAGRQCGRDGGVDRVAALTQNCHDAADELAVTAPDRFIPPPFRWSG